MFAYNFEKRFHMIRLSLSDTRDKLINEILIQVPNVWKVFNECQRGEAGLSVGQLSLQPGRDHRAQTCQVGRKLAR